MWYVYILKTNNDKLYRGCTVNVEQRVIRHQHGHVPATKNYRPVSLIFYCAFTDRFKAYKFEKYLKSGSGRAFTNKHLI